MLSWKQCALPVITTMALWQLMHLGIWCTYIYILNIYIYIYVYHVPKCMNCHKAVVVLTGRAHCFHDNIYVMLNLLLRDLAFCVSWITYDHLHVYIYIVYMYFYLKISQNIYIYIYIRWKRLNRDNTSKK